MLDRADIDFNNNVLRKALKALMFDDFKMSDYQRMTSTTLDTIKDRYVAGDDSEAEGGNAMGFFSLTCCQVLLKLVKNISGKMRLKD